MLSDRALHATLYNDERSGINSYSPILKGIDIVIDTDHNRDGKFSTGIDRGKPCEYADRKILLALNIFPQEVWSWLKRI